MAMRIEEVRGELARRLRDRRPEIEAAILARVQAVSEQQASPDPEYAHGLRATVSAAVEHGLGALERSESHAPPIPSVALSQARIAAHSGISLDTVLRRYFAGYSLLSDYVIEEAVQGPIGRGASLQALLRAQAALFDRLIVAVGEEYSRAQHARPGSSEQRKAERVRRLLAGELLETTELAYAMQGHHLGVVALGPGAVDAIRGFTSSRDYRLLLVRREEGAVWAWLGSARQLASENVAELLAWAWPADVSVALGEPGEDLDGWRLTHRQASAALPIARRSGRQAVRYADVALLASMLRDDLLVTSLRELYIAPLCGEREGGGALRETLRAYFAHDRNVSSAAAALDVARQTVQRRLHAAEQVLGTPMGARAMEIEAALRLEELDDF